MTLQAGNGDRRTSILEWSHGGTILADYRRYTNHITVWNTLSGNIVCKFQKCSATLIWLRWCPNDKQIASYPNYHSTGVSVWDAVTGVLLYEISNNLGLTNIFWNDHNLESGDAVTMINRTSKEVFIFDYLHQRKIASYAISEEDLNAKNNVVDAFLVENGAFLFVIQKCAIQFVSCKNLEQLEWVCEACTFLNARNSTSCEMCSTLCHKSRSISLLSQKEFFYVWINKKRKYC